MIQAFFVWLLGPDIAMTLFAVGSLLGVGAILLRWVEGEWPWEVGK